MRFELTTFSLARRRSTTELRPQAVQFDVLHYSSSINLCQTGYTLVNISLAAVHPVLYSPSDPSPTMMLAEVDPVGFEPTIFSLQRRRLPARPRAHQLVSCTVPTRGLEPPHLAVIDPKSIASAIPPRRLGIYPKIRSCPALHSLARHSTVYTTTVGPQPNFGLGLTQAILHSRRQLSPIITEGPGRRKYAGCK